MGEMRGRFVTRLQELHRQQQAAQNEYKADMDAWNTLMNTTVKVRYHCQWIVTPFPILALLTMT